MAALFLHPSGLLAWRLSDDDERANPIPAGSTLLVRFDENVPSNLAVLKDAQKLTERYSLVVGPTLRKDGLPVAGFPAPETMALATKRRAEAKAQFSQAGSPGKRDRAIVLCSVDAVNTLRQWIMDYKAAVAAATTLVDLKARVALLPNLPEITPAQAKSAILNKLDSGNADS